LTASPGARAHYQRRRDAGDPHTAAVVAVFSRAVGPVGGDPVDRDQGAVQHQRQQLVLDRFGQRSAELGRAGGQCVDGHAGDHENAHGGLPRRAWIRLGCVSWSPGIAARFTIIQPLLGRRVNSGFPTVSSLREMTDWRVEPRTLSTGPLRAGRRISALLYLTFGYVAGMSAVPAGNLWGMHSPPLGHWPSPRHDGPPQIWLAGCGGRWWEIRPWALERRRRRWRRGCRCGTEKATRTI
jgi:hypothetical protein